MEGGGEKGAGVGEGGWGEKGGGYSTLRDRTQAQQFRIASYSDDVNTSQKRSIFE